MQEEETHNLHETPKNGLRHLRPPETWELPECNNNGDIRWYGRMPTNPLLVEPKGEKPLGKCEGEDATLEATDPVTDN